MTVLLRLLRPYSWRVLLAVGLGAVVVASNMGLLAAAAYLIAAASVTHLMALLIIPMYAVRILSATRGSARYFERLVSHRITFDILARLRVRVYDRFRRLGPAGMRGITSGDALGRVMADVEDLQDAYLLTIAPVSVAVLIALLTLIVLSVFDGAIALVTVGYLIACGVLVPLAVGALSRTEGRAFVAARAELNEHLVDTIQGIRDIVSNGAGPRFLQRTEMLLTRMGRAESRIAAIIAGREGVADLLANLATLSALALAILLVTHHVILDLYIVVPALIAFAAFEAVRPLGQAAERLSRVRAAARRVEALSAETPIAVPTTPDHPAPLLPPYSIRFEHVTLRHPGADRDAVSDVTLEVPAEGRIAIVGPSGAGKTTLVHLLTRALDPTGGRVLIGGRDIRDCSLHALRTVVGVVGQESYIFNDTLRKNLALARRDASTDELEEAVAAVGLLDLVRGLPEGLDTWVGEHGERLSGGERQRLAVARVLLQDAPIVVLDEVTANLDPMSETRLIDTLDRATRGRTVVTITHRLIGMDRKDDIVVLDRGRVVEQGTHQTLAASDGLYAGMLAIQDNMLAAFV